MPPLAIARRVDCVQGVIRNILVEACKPTGKPDGVLRCPSAALGVVVARSEAGEARLVIVETTREAEGLFEYAGVVLSRDISYMSKIR
jgi:hypothetical protein